MANLTIRDLPDQTKETLRVCAAQTGISLEAYVRHILQKASRSDVFVPVNILKLADQCFGAKHGIDLDLPDRGSQRPSVDLH
jgi:antitoxin FitA